MDLSSVAFPVNTPKFWGNEKAWLRCFVVFVELKLISCVILHCIALAMRFLEGVGGELHRDWLDFFRRHPFAHFLLCCTDMLFAST